MQCFRVTIEALSASFFAPGYNNEGCTSLPVPPPSAIQGLLSAATGLQEQNIQVGWMMTFHETYTDYEKIVPARRFPNVDDFEPYRTGFRLRRTPVKRTFLIEPRLTVYVEERLASALRTPYHTIRLGRSQDLAWVTEVEPVNLEPVSEADVEGIIVPFPFPSGGAAAFLWAVPETASGYDKREWLRPKPYAFLTKPQYLKGLSNFFLDAEKGRAIPLYQL